MKKILMSFLFLVMGLAIFTIPSFALTGYDFIADDTLNYSGGATQSYIPYMLNGSFNYGGPNENQYVWGIAQTVNGTQKFNFGNSSGNNRAFASVDSTNSVRLPTECEVCNDTGGNFTPTLVWNDPSNGYNNYVAVWHFNEKASPFGDSTGNGNIGTITGSNYDSGVSTPLGKGLNFTASSTYLTVADNAMLDSTSFSIESKVMFGTAPTLNNGNLIVEKHNVGNDNAGYVLIYISGPGNTLCGGAQADANSFAFVIENPRKCVSAWVDAVTNVWYNITATYDGTTAKIYYNGILTNSSTATYTASTNDIKIGEDGPNARWQFYGTFDELRLSNTSYSADQVMARYQAMSPGFSVFGTPQQNQINQTPMVTIDSPTNTTYNVQSTLLTYTITPGTFNTSTCWYILNSTSNVSLPNCNNITFTASKGWNNITVFVNDTQGKVGSSSTVFFSVNFVPPTVSMTSPTNTTYTTTSVPLTFTATGVSSAINNCWYIYDSNANVTITSCENISIPVTSGWHNVTVFASDTLGSVGSSSTVFFSVNFAPPTPSISSPTNTTYYGNNTIWLNFKATDPYSSTFQLTAVLDGTIVYNNAGYTNNTNIVLSENVPIGLHNFTVTATNTPYGGSSSTTVFFSTFIGLSISVFLPGGGAVSGWTLNSVNFTSNITLFNQNNPSLISYANIANGNVLLNVTQNGYDNSSKIITINSAMGFQQLNFTIYPFTNITYGAVGYGNFTNWFLTIANSTGIYFNTTVSTTYITSNRYLSSGNNTFTGSGVFGFATHSLSKIINLGVGYDIFLNTTPITAQIWAQDEITLIKKYWNSQFTLGGDNLTATFISGVRKGLSCMFDGDNTTACFSVGDHGTIISTNVTFGQDFNNATYVFSYGVVVPTSGCTSPSYEITAQDSTGTLHTLFTDSFTTYSTVGTTIRTTYITLSNTNRSYPKAINFNLTITPGTCGTPISTNLISEFNMINNSAGYLYVDDYTVTMPSFLISNFSSIIAQFTGEATYQTDYTTTRNYYLTTSPIASYNIVGYLLKDFGNNGYYQYFTVLDANNQPITDATLTFGKWYGGSENTIAQCRTSASGTCQFWIQSNQPLYSLRASASGYVTYYNQSVSYVTGQGVAYIYLSTGQNVAINSPFAGVESGISPDALYYNNATNFTCTVFGSLGNINKVNFTILRLTWLNNITTYASVSTTSNPSGTSITIPINDNGQFQLGCSYEWVSNVTGNATVYRNTNSKTIWVYADSLENSATAAGFDPAFALIIALGIIMIVCTPIAFISPSYGLVTAIFMFLIFAWVGMIPDVVILNSVVSGWSIAGLGILTALSLLFLKSYV